MFDVPGPPAWLNDAALTFLRHIAQPLYWLLFCAGVLAYIILRWQRRPQESRAAQGLRIREAGKSILWLALGLGRVAGQWQIVLWAVAVLITACSVIWWLIALYLTYIRPARRRSVAVVEEVLPAYTGTERRSGIERRAGWRNVSE